MRGGNRLKNYIMAGLIAGIGSGIVNFIFEISGLFELFSMLPHIIPMNIQSLAIYSMVHYTIWGIIFGSFYAFFYDFIPAKGIKKGLVYGLIIWIITPIHNAGVNAIYGWYIWAIPYTLATFFSIGIVYGLVLGLLYKKPTK